MLSTTERELTQVDPEHFRRLQDEKITAAVAAGDVLVSLSGTRRNGARLWDHAPGGRNYGRVVALYVTWGRGTDGDFLFLYVRHIKPLGGDGFVATLDTHFDGSGSELQVCYADGAPIETIVTRVLGR